MKTGDTSTLLVLCALLICGSVVLALLSGCFGDRTTVVEDHPDSPDTVVVGCEGNVRLVGLAEAKELLYNMASLLHRASTQA